MTEISDEAVEAFRAARHNHNCGGDPLCCDRAGLAAAAPLIVAEALRDAATDVAVSTYHRECRQAVAGRLWQIADQVAADPGAEHRYLSTACHHGQHGYCGSTVGLAGPKTPRTCKFCPAVCVCACHRLNELGDVGEETR